MEDLAVKEVEEVEEVVGEMEEVEEGSGSVVGTSRTWCAGTSCSYNISI